MNGASWSKNGRIICTRVTRVERFTTLCMPPRLVQLSRRTGRTKPYAFHCEGFEEHSLYQRFPLLSRHLLRKCSSYNVAVIRVVEERPRGGDWRLGKHQFHYCASLLYERAFQ